jgi:hypothetical protein
VRASRDRVRREQENQETLKKIKPWKAKVQILIFQSSKFAQEFLLVHEWL